MQHLVVVVIVRGAREEVEYRDIRATWSANGEGKGGWVGLANIVLLLRINIILKNVNQVVLVPEPNQFTVFNT